jgi:RNA polymerase sigma-70 factor (ECF subfamily)
MVQAVSTYDPAQLGTLLEEAREGDVEARGRLIERYRNYLMLLARLQLDQELHRKEGGSDVVQQTFLEAVRDFDRFQGATLEEFEAWLRRMLARNLANLIRRYRGTAARNIALERQLDQQLDRSSATVSHCLAARGPSPSEHAARSEESLLLADALAQLPEHYQKVGSIKGTF